MIAADVEEQPRERGVQPEEHADAPGHPVAPEDADGGEHREGRERGEEHPAIEAQHIADGSRDGRSDMSGDGDARLRRCLAVQPVQRASDDRPVQEQPQPQRVGDRDEVGDERSLDGTRPCSPRDHRRSDEDADRTSPEQQFVARQEAEREGERQHRHVPHLTRAVPRDQRVQRDREQEQRHDLAHAVRG